MMQAIEKSTETVVVFLLVDSEDFVTAETGITPTVTISKNGGAFAAATNSPAEISSGFYKITLTTTETNTAGPLALLATGTGCAPYRAILYVTDGVNVDSIAGTALSTLDALANKVSDHMLRRAMDTARASSDGDTVEKQSLLGALSKMVNKTALSGSTLTVYEEDNTTSFYTQTVTTDSNADPVTSVT